MSVAKLLTFSKMREMFKTSGFEDHEIQTIISGLVTLWRCNELIEDITREAVFSELDLDELTAHMLWNAISVDMLALAQEIKTYAEAGKLIRWVVKPYAILVELEDENIYP